MPVTTRDKIWTVATELREAVEDSERRDELELSDRYGIPGFTVKDVRENADTDLPARTVRDCLNAMTSLGELAKRTSRPSRYRAAGHAGHDTAGRAGWAPAKSDHDADGAESGISVSVDVEDDSSTDEGERVDWEALDLPGSGETLAARQDAVRDCYEFLRENGTATRAEFCADAFDGDGVGYASETSAWKNCIIDGLGQVAERVESVEAPAEGEHTWRWAGGAAGGSDE